MERFLKVLTFWFLMILVFGCHFGAVNLTDEDRVLLNQEGYLTDGPKQILIIGSAQEFRVENSHGNEVLTGTVPEVQYWPHSGDSVAIVDLSNINDAGEFVIFLDNKMVPHKFIVSENPYAGLDKSAIRAFFLNRSAMAIDSVFGGQWARQAGHPDTAVKIHASAATEKRPKGTVISSPRGGPNLATFEDCPDAERSEFPAKSFVDLECSYSTNEIDINWNAPLVYLSGGLRAIIEEE